MRTSEQLWRLLTEPRYLVAEELLLAALLLTGLLRPTWGWEWFARVEAWGGKLARQPGRASAALFIGLIGLRLALLPLFPVPVPHLHSEYSAQLAAGTFAQFRLANAPHPFWEHFESPEIIHQPGYASILPPGQGLLQAAGMLAGHPWIGILVSAGAMPVLLYWMLRGWVPAQWALLGACLAALRWCLYTYWMNGYWGGALAACGGALAVGAMGGLRRSADRRLGYVMGVGFGILLLTLPVEGLFVGVPLLVVLRRRVLGLVWPLTVILIPVVVWMGYYNWRVTGDALRTAAEAGRAQYGTSAPFVFQEHGAAPEFRHAALRDFDKWERELHLERRARPLFTMLMHVAAGWRFLLGPALTVAGLGLLWGLRGKMLPLAAIGGVALAGAAAETWMHPHALAPVCGLLLVMLVQSLRYLHAVSFWGIPYGIVLVRVVGLTCVAMLFLPPAYRLLGIPLDVSYAAWWSIEGKTERPRIQRELESAEGWDLVMVRYASDEPIGERWVYNEADIDRAGIVWAREMSREKDRALLRYFAGRRVWLLEPNLYPVRLKEYVGRRD